MIDIAEIKNKDEWENTKTGSLNKNELIVFKFSPVCTVSFTAGKILETWCSKLDSDNGLKIVQVNVIKSRALSNKIENETSVRHESPQIIWFEKNGNIKWHGSHFMISAKSLSAQLEAV